MSEKPTLVIFTDGVNIGAISDTINGVFLNNISDGKQLGVVVSAEHVVITQEAKEVLMHAKREGGSFAPIMLTTSAHDGSGSVAIFGMTFHLSDPLIGRDCDKSVLEKLTVVKFETPAGFFSM